MKVITLSNLTLPSVTAEGSLTRYLQEIRKFPILMEEEEYQLAKSWKEHNDIDSAHKLVTSHLRLVVKIAMGYRGYHLPMSDLIAEGNTGLMQAVKRFDPEKGFRLATYAMWWIRASIQEYILHSWSLVKIGTTSAQKKLFFNLRKIKSELKLINDGNLDKETVAEIAKRLNVAEKEVISMNGRLSGPDSSLNAPISSDGESEWQDWLSDENSENQEVKFVENEDLSRRRALLGFAISQLNEREREIFNSRRVLEEQLTLEQLAEKYGVSRERIRQIEVRAFEKVQRIVLESSSEFKSDEVPPSLPNPKANIIDGKIIK